MSGAGALGALWNGYVVLLHATVYLAGVACVLPLARRAGPAAVARTHAAALVGLLLVSALCWLPLGAWGRAAPAVVSAPLVAIGAARVAADAGEASAAGAGALARLVLAAWIGGSALVLARLAAAWLTMRAVTRRAAPARDRELARALREACAAAGTGQVVELRLSDEVATPLTWGALDPVILLPAAARGWPAERLRLALLHELAHVRRADCLVQALGQLALAWYWFHPGAWWAARGLRAAREEACDARVLAAGARPSDYAQCLLDVATEARGRAPGAAVALAMARRPGLRSRVRRVLAPGAAARAAAAAGRPGRAARAALAACACWLLLLGTLRVGPQRAALWHALRAGAWPERAYAASVLRRSRHPAVRAELRARAGGDPHPLVRRIARAAR